MNGFPHGLTFSARDRRTLRTGAIALVLIVMVGRVLPAWHAWRARAVARSVRERAALADVTALLGVRRALHDSLVARERRLGALRGVLIHGDSPAAQGGSLAALITQAAESAHVTVGALGIHTEDGADAAPDAMHDPASGAPRSAPARDAPSDYRAIRVQGSATGDIQGAAIFLALLEKERPHLAVRSLTLTQPDVGAPRDHAEALHLEFLVEGMGALPAEIAPSRGGRSGSAP